MKSIRTIAILLSGGLAVINVVLLSVFWGKIPQTIPMHVGPDSTIDSYKGKEYLLYLAALGIGLAVVAFVAGKNAPVSAGGGSPKHKNLFLGITSVIFCLFLLLYSGLTVFKYSV